MKIHILVILLFMFGLISCDTESYQSKKAKTEKMCKEMTSIENLDFVFCDYLPEDIDSLFICIKSVSGKQECKIDTIRKKIINQEEKDIRICYNLNQKILLTDTLFIKLKNEPVKKIYGFEYGVFGGRDMLGSHFWCGLESLVVNDQIQPIGGFDKKVYLFHN
ncbi:MAG: hypothetical protein J0M08_04570 [Bacteroidetes bacterium]|nr:hypothetical protein [Bacteroidota bacterium]